MNALTSKLKETVEENKDRLLQTKSIDLELLKKIGPVTPQKIPFILWKYPQILPDSLRSKLLKEIQDFSLAVAANLAGGFGINVFLPRIFPKFNELPSAAKIPLKLSVYVAPFAATLPLLQQKIDAYMKLVNTASGVVEGAAKLQKLGSFIK